MSARLLVIDDEESLCEILKYNLQREGYEVDTANSAEEALTMDLAAYDLFVVDVMMERLSGFDFAKRVRSTSGIETSPIIFCTALTGEDDTVMGLNIGADDYITKPFVISEVVARVRAVLRRSSLQRRVRAVAAQKQGGPVSLPDVKYRDLVINQNAKRASIDGADLALTRTEYALLLFLLTHRDCIYSRDEIMNEVWPDDQVVTSRTIDTNITRLRRKIGPYGANIVTRLGFGYGFHED